MQQTYRLTGKQLDQAKAALVKLQSRALKIGVTPITLKVTGYEDEHQEDGTIIRIALLELTGEAPVIDGWTFVAILQHEATGNSIRRVPQAFDVSIPDHFRSVPCICDVCGTRRSRKDTYLLVSALGEFKLVGSSCLKDFCGGHPDPHGLVRYLQEVDETMAEIVRSPHSDEERMIPVREYLAHVVAVVERYGYVKRGDATGYPTAYHALSSFRTCHGSSTDLVPVTDAHQHIADQALAWVREYVPFRDSPLSDYEHNLVIVCRDDVVHVHRNVRIVASLIPAWFKAQRRIEGEIIRRNSQHVGALDHPLTIRVTVTKAIPISAGPRYRPRPGEMYVLNDDAGNVLIWRCYGQTQLVVGETYTLRGTVAEHSVYHGIEQTVLTRCRVVNP